VEYVTGQKKKKKKEREKIKKCPNCG